MGAKFIKREINTFYGTEIDVFSDKQEEEQSFIIHLINFKPYILKEMSFDSIEKKYSIIICRSKIDELGERMLFEYIRELKSSRITINYER
jgi:hypothetical protein